LNRTLLSLPVSALLRFFLAMSMPFIFLACTSGTKGMQVQQKAVPVEAGTVVRKMVPLQIRTIGNVEAYATVGVKAQMGGELIKVHFREGQEVTKGDLLFTIDPRPYEAALRQAEANLARDATLLENARQESGRYEELVKKGYVTESQYDQVRASADALDASVRADRAAVENARLLVGYCFIHSPITGKTGNLIADQGNLIKANADNPMVVINQIQPIYVSFSVPEKHLPEIKRHMSSRQLKVEALVEKGEKRPAEGVLTFVDNAVDSTTGTIHLKGTFDNRDKRLWPGQFVDVILTLAIEQGAIVVPSESVQTGQGGQFVYVVRSDYTVESRPVVINRNLGNETVVEKGLQAGEKVVTNGQLRLVPGTKVEVKDGGGAAKARADEPL
jgi:multidrug efflux system membrane fusion protein